MHCFTLNSSTINKWVAPSSCRGIFGAAGTDPATDLTDVPRQPKPGSGIISDLNST